MKRRRKKMHRQKPGAVPGTLAAPPEAKSSDAEYILYTAKSCESAELSEKVRKPDEGVLWINVEGLSDIATIERLGKQFQLHRLSLEDIFYEKRPKAEFHENYLLFCVPMLHNDGVEHVALFLGQSYVLSFQEGTPGDSFEPVRDRIRQGQGLIRSRGADYLAYTLLDAIIDGFFPTVDRWSHELSELEEQLLGATSAHQVEAIREVRRKATHLKRVLRPFRDALSSIVNHRPGLIEANTIPYYRDCHDHVVELIEILTTQRELTSELLDIYQSRLDQRTNEAMQTLTVIATIFIPLSFVAGVYGMNFDGSVSVYNMPELRWTYGYPLILSLMGLIGFSQYAYFRRKGWLSGSSAGGRNSYRD